MPEPEPVTRPELKERERRMENEVVDKQSTDARGADVVVVGGVTRG